MKKKIIFITLVSLLIFCFFNTVHADTTIHLDIETSTGPLFNQDITVAPCDNSNNNNGTMAITAYCAVLQAGLQQPSLASTWDWSWPPGAFLSSVGSTTNGNGIYWGWFVNSTLGSTGLNEYNLASGDSILLNYGINPLKISVDNQSPTVGNTIKFTVTEFGYDSSFNPVWSPAIGGKIVIESNSFDLDDTGSYSFTVPNTNTFTVKGQLANFLDTPQITITPTAPIIISGGGGPQLTNSSDGGTYIPSPPAVKPVFDIKKAYDFLSSQQKDDGSFGDNIYTDWTALALASGNNTDQTPASPHDNSGAGWIKLIKYYADSKMDNATLTDYERRAMALMALGLNPYNTNNENYIQKITDSFDGKQFGDVNEDNDDIFALIVLQNAGFTQTDGIINSDISFITSEQKEDGSWDESVDMTGAGIEALSVFNQDQEVKNVLTKAEAYLKQNQKNTGGWGNVSSTAWAVEGILALSEKPEDWVPARNAESLSDTGGNNGNTPLNYLAANQDIDGGIKDDNTQNKLWETSYAVTALSAKTWNQIMQKFEKPKILAAAETKTEPVQKIATLKNSGLENVNISGSQKIKTITKIKSENLVNQNTAAVINAVNNSPATTTKTGTQKENWFANFFKKIFSIF